MSIRVILADDHEIMRQGLQSLLEKESEIEVVGEAKNGHRTVKLAAELKPDVIVMDITMPDLNGIEATRLIVSEQPGPKVIALSMHSDREFISEMFRAGASGYLLKQCAFEELAHAIRIVMSGQIYLSPSITGIVMEGFVNQVTSTKSKAPCWLTPREREVLQNIVEGKNTKQIASRLFLSEKTIETHRRNIMKKLNIHSISGLTKYAIRHGLTPLEE